MMDVSVLYVLIDILAKTLQCIVLSFALQHYIGAIKCGRVIGYDCYCDTDDDVAYYL